MSLKLFKTLKDMVEVLNTATLQHMKQFEVSFFNISCTPDSRYLSTVETVAADQTKDEVISRIKEQDQLLEVFINELKLIAVKWPHVSNIISPSFCQR